MKIKVVLQLFFSGYEGHLSFFLEKRMKILQLPAPHITNPFPLLTAMLPLQELIPVFNFS